MNPSNQPDRDGTSWDQPRAITTVLPAVEPFDAEWLLPSGTLPYVRHVARDLQMRIDGPSITMAAALAGAIGRRACIRPKPGRDWTVYGILWGVLVMPSGSMKSPCIDRTLCFLEELEAEALLDYQRRLRLHQMEESASDPTPVCTRYIVNEATIAALHKILANNPAGVFFVRDEIMGLMEKLRAKGSEGDRQFLLEAWSGHRSITVDRIGRGTVYAPHAAVSVFGTTQPGRMEQVVSAAVRNGDLSDGFLPRFQLAVWPDPQPDWTYTDDPPEPGAVEAVGALFRRIVELPADDSREYRFDSDAQVFFIEYLTSLEIRLRRQIVESVLREHLGKYRSLMPALSLLLQVCEDPTSLEIPLHRAVRAAHWCRYLESHARRVYACVITGPDEPTKTLAERLKAGALGVRFTVREVYKNDWAGLTTPDAVRNALEELQEAGWVRKMDQATGSKGGRPSEVYEVNPGVYRE